MKPPDRWTAPANNGRERPSARPMGDCRDWKVPTLPGLRSGLLSCLQ